MLAFLLIGFSCRKAYVQATADCTTMQTTAHPKGSDVQSLMDNYVQKGLPGMAILIGDSNGVWFGASGKADIEHNIPYSPCTVNKVGSVTKMMLGVLIMKLVEEGKVNINDKISKWLDDYYLHNIENGDEVTLRDCMNHTTGIYDVINSSDFYLAVLHNPNKNWTGKELLEYVEGQPAAFPAHSKAGYSNTNYILLSLCLEKITRTDHATLLRNKVLNPLNMHDTYYHWHEGLPKNTAQGYYDLYNNQTIINVSNIMTGNGNGYNGVYSNVFDLQKFVKGVFIDKTLLMQQSLDTMMQWNTDVENTDLGLSLFKRDTDKGADYRIGHTGGDLGYATEVYYFPKTNRYFILNVNYGTNGNSFLKPTYLQLVRDLADLVKK